MDTSISLNPQTFHVIDYLYQLSYRDPYFHPFRRKFFRENYFDSNIEYIRHELKELNTFFAESDIARETRPLYTGEQISDWYWLTYDKTLEVIPIYEDGIALVQKELILPTNEISYLLSYIVIPGTKNGVDIDNHNHGYHFHYGKVTKNRLKRYDLLLSFNPSDKYPPTPPKTTPLYSEKHGGYKPIDVSTIGNNKRRPIYTVCESVMAKRGITNFKQPGSSALVFYP